MTENLNRRELKLKLEEWIPEGMDSEAVTAGVAGALLPAEDRTRPIERGLLGDDALYAWRSDDVPIVESALKSLGEVVASGLLAPAFLGLTLVELVTFLVRLRRNRARLTDPGLIAVLLLLKDGPPGGMSATDLAKGLERMASPPFAGRSEVERALDTLAAPKKGERPHPLVERDGNLWKSLV